MTTEQMDALDGDDARSWFRRNRWAIGFLSLWVGVLIAIGLVVANGRADDSDTRREQERSNAALVALAGALTNDGCHRSNDDRAGTIQILVSTRDRSQQVLDADRSSLSPAAIAARENSIAQLNTLIVSIQTDILPPINCKEVVAQVPKTYEDLLRRLK